MSCLSCWLYSTIQRTSSQRTMRSTFQLLKNAKCKMFSVSWSWPWSCLCPCPCYCPYLNFDFTQMPLLHKLSVDALKQQSLITAHTINTATATATGSITENGTSKMYILYATNANIVQILRRLSFGLRFKGIANDAYQKCKMLLLRERKGQFHIIALFKYTIK